MACEGQGMIEQEMTVPVRIPPMVRDRTVIEVPIEGLGVHTFSCASTSEFPVDPNRYAFRSLFSLFCEIFFSNLKKPKIQSPKH
jgi:hypothetical protein